MKGCNKPVVVVSRKTDLPNLTEPVSKRAEPQFKGWSTSRVKITFSLVLALTKLRNNTFS